jgi:hypothetical protein
MRTLRYPLIVAVVVVVIGILFGGQWLYTEYVLEKPVVDALDLPEVVNTEYVEDTGTVIVTLKEVENLKATYLEIQDRLETNQGAGNLQIEVADNRSPLLEEAWYQSQFAVHQAVVQGDFVSMHQTINEIASGYKLDRYAVFIDSNRVYVQFHKDGKNLYEVISREIPGKEGIAPQNGSEEL